MWPTSTASPTNSANCRMMVDTSGSVRSGMGCGIPSSCSSCHILVREVLLIHLSSKKAGLSNTACASSPRESGLSLVLSFCRNFCCRNGLQAASLQVSFGFHSFDHRTDSENRTADPIPLARRTPHILVSSKGTTPSVCIQNRERISGSKAQSPLLVHIQESQCFLFSRFGGLFSYGIFFRRFQQFFSEHYF